MKAICSRLAASSCVIRSRLTATCYSCCQSRSRPHECGTYFDPHVCDDERLDEKHAHADTHSTYTDTSDESGALTLNKFNGAVYEVAWDDAANSRAQGLGGRNKMLNHYLVGYVSENVEGYAAR